MSRILLLLLCAWLSACGVRPSSEKTDQRYELTGRVTALDAKNRVATVNAAAIPHFMDAMTMDYPVKSEPEFDNLKVGERIKATVTVHGDSTYDLSGIQRQNQ